MSRKYSIITFVFLIFISVTTYIFSTSRVITAEEPIQEIETDVISAIDANVIKEIEINIVSSKDASTDLTAIEESGSTHLKDNHQCFKLIKDEMLSYREIVNNFDSEYVVTSFSVAQYLTKLSEEELIAEYEAGNYSAAYVLGMNYIHSSRYDVWFSPYLSIDINVPFGKPKKFNVINMEKGRAWLWKAALNNIVSAMIEIGASYQHEIRAVKEEFKKDDGEKLTETQLDKLIELESKRIAHLLLGESIAIPIFAIIGEAATPYKDQFEKLDNDNKYEIYNAIESQWIEDRHNLGRAREIEIKLPEKVQEAFGKLSNACF